MISSSVGTVDFTDEEMSLIKNIFDSICFYPYKSDNTYKGEKVTSTLSYMLPYVPFFLVYHDYQCICGEVMERQYNNENDCLMLNCCGEEYSEDEFEMCRDCGNYIHNSVSEYDEETDEFYCGGCI